MAGGLRALGATRVHLRRRPLAGLGPTRSVGPAHVDVGLAGTVMRFLPPVAGLAAGRVTFDGDAHMRKRPLGPLIGGAARRSAYAVTPLPAVSCR